MVFSRLLHFLKQDCGKRGAAQASAAFTIDFFGKLWHDAVTVCLLYWGGKEDA